VLGLSRTTTWTILTGKHKGYGLSVDTLNRMLSARRLPPIVRAKINEYIREKAAGLYGDSAKRIRNLLRFNRQPQPSTANTHMSGANSGEAIPLRGLGVVPWHTKKPSSVCALASPWLASGRQSRRAVA
jgi:hypothetical protein